MSRTDVIAKNTIFLYIRMALTMVVSLYTVRVVLQALGVEDYGIYSAVGGVVSTLSLFTGALSSAAQRFLSIEIGKGDTEGLNRVFSSLFLLYLLAGILILIIAETAGVWFLNHEMKIPYERMDAAYIILQSTLISFFVSIVISPFIAIIIAKENMKIYAYVGVYDVVIKLLIAYLLQLFNTDKLILYAILLCFASISSHLFYLIFTNRQYKDVRLCLRWDSVTIKDIVGFSSWSFVGSLAFLCNAQGLNLLLNVFFGPIVNAAYNIGNSVKNAVNQLGCNFFVAVKPSLIKAYSANNLEFVRKLFVFSSKVIFCLLFIIMFPILIETEDILLLWLGELGDHMVSFVRLMLVWSLFLNLSDPITTVVQAAGKVKEYHLKVDIFTLLSLPLAYISFKFGASPEAALGISIFILIVAHLIRLFILRTIIKIGILNYLKEIVLRILGATCCSFALSIFIIHFINPLFIRLSVEILIVVISSYLIVFDKVERTRVNEMIKGLLNKLYSRS